MYVWIYLTVLFRGTTTSGSRSPTSDTYFSPQVNSILISRPAKLVHFMILVKNVLLFVWCNGTVCFHAAWQPTTLYNLWRSKLCKVLIFRRSNVFRVFICRTLPANECLLYSYLSSKFMWYWYRDLCSNPLFNIQVLYSVFATVHGERKKLHCCNSHNI